MSVVRFATLIAALIACMTQSASGGGEASTDVIRRTFEARYPDEKVIDVSPSAVPGLFEVFTGTAVVYTTASVDLMFPGPLVDTKTKKDLTALRLDERNSIEFSTLPLDRGIKIVKGNGRRKLAVFSDPDCPYCQKLEQELQPMTDLTVYVLLYPLTDLHPNALRHAKAIWCSPDRASAWTRWVLKREEPRASACSGDPVTEIHALAQTLRVPGTPTLYLANGQRISHDVDRAELEQLLTSASKPTESVVGIEGCAPKTAAGSACRAPN